MYIPEFFIYFLASQPPMLIKYHYTYMVILFNQFTVAYWSHMMTSNWVNKGSGNGLWRDYFNQHNLLLLDSQEEISMKSWYNTFYKRLNFNMLQEFWPLCPEANELILNVRGPSYLGLTRSIWWLLMPWLLTSPGHQQPWYWLCRICRSWSYLRKDFKYMCHINVE